MRRLRWIALFAVASTAVCGAAASTAAAEAPEYEVCAKALVKEGGTFDDKTCTEPSEGKHGEGGYELAGIERAKKMTFTGALGRFEFKLYSPREGLLEEYGCRKGKVAGEVTGPKSGTAVYTLEGCELDNRACTSAGAARGDIVSTALGTTLAANGSGVKNELRGSGAKHVVMEFNCEGSEITVNGAISAEVTEQVGKVSKYFGNVFETYAGGEPLIEAVEPLLTSAVGTAENVPTGVSVQAALKGEAFEIT